MLDTIFVLLLIGAIVFAIYTYAGQRKRKQQVQQKNHQREEIGTLFINDFLHVLQTQAPNFKYIYIGCNNPYCSDKDNIIITDAQGRLLKYNYLSHQFQVGDTTRERLAKEVTARYGGICRAETRDISRDTHASMVTVSFRVIAHEGLREEQEKQMRNDSIRRC